MCETEQFLLECQRSREVWGRMAQIGLDEDINYKSVKYGIFMERLSAQVKELYRQTMHICRFKNLENKVCGGPRTKN